MVALLTEPCHRQVLLGDMEEEYRALWATSPKSARTWYWHQSVRSSLPLLWARWRAYQRQTGPGLWISMSVAVVAIYAWEHWVALAGAWRFASALEPGHLGLARACYLVFKLLGLVTVGFALWAGYRERFNGKVLSAGIRLWPLVLWILGPLLSDLFSASDHGLWVLRLVLLIFALPAWFLGMYLGKSLLPQGS